MGAIVEREVKFPIASWREGEALLAGPATSISQRRYRELNSLFDFSDGSLRAKGKALRLRRARGLAWLTLKEPAAGDRRLKHRNEYQSAVADADAIEQLLRALGMREQFRYEKYRQVYLIGDLEACLDETPIGCYLELEGSPDSIESVVEQLGLSLDDAVVRSYPELYDHHRRLVPDAPSFMVFPDEEGRS